ncbi:MAG: murein biosynthesis integral membrane protein MurJ [Mesorhizobium sp.]
MSLIRRAGTVGGLTLLSRVFGFGRDVVMAAILGAGPLADAFMVAFRLPNHFRAIVAEGAFNSAFIPTYAALREREGEAAAASFRSTILAWSLAANGILLAIALVATGWVVAILAPGLGDDPGQHALAVDLTRITFPYLACMSVVTLMSGVLNAHDRFAAAAAAPILLNVAMTVALLAASAFPTAAHAAAWGVIAGGVLQVVFVAMACARAGLRFTLSPPRLDPAVTTFFRRFGPAILGAGGVQIAMFADTIIATFLPTGSLSFLYYADRLYQLPLAVIGIAIGTALLPDLSRRFSDPGDASAPASLGHAVAVCLVLGIPCAVGLSLLGDLVIEVLFARGAFTPAAVAGAAGALAAYALGLPAAVALRALVSGFHARGDTLTPVKALGLSTVVNVGLKLLLVGPLAHAGLALATAVGVTVYAGILALWLALGKSIRIPLDDRTRILAVLAGAVLVAAAILLLRHPVETMSLTLVPRWRAEATLAALCMLSLGLFAIDLGAAEAWNRRRTRR